MWNLRPEFNSSTQNYAIKRAKLFVINSSTIAVHPRVTLIFNDISELKEKIFNHFHWKIESFLKFFMQVLTRELEERVWSKN